MDHLVKYIRMFKWRVPIGGAVQRRDENLTYNITCNYGLIMMHYPDSILGGRRTDQEIYK